MDWFERREAFSIGRLVGGIAPARSERHFDRHARRLGRLFDPDIASEHDDISHAGAGFRRNRNQHGKNAGQSFRFIADPVLLRGETDFLNTIVSGDDPVACLQAFHRNLPLRRRDQGAGGEAGHDFFDVGEAQAAGDIAIGIQKLHPTVDAIAIAVFDHTGQTIGGSAGQDQPVKVIAPRATVDRVTGPLQL